MDKVIYILLGLFVGYNVLLGIALLAKACGDTYGAWQAAPVAKKSSRGVAKARRGVRKEAARQDQRAASAAPAYTQ